MDTNTPLTEELQLQKYHRDIRTRHKIFNGRLNQFNVWVHLSVMEWKTFKPVICCTQLDTHIEYMWWSSIPCLDLHITNFVPDYKLKMTYILRYFPHFPGTRKWDCNLLSNNFYYRNWLQNIKMLIFVVHCISVYGHLQLNIQQLCDDVISGQAVNFMNMCPD